MYNNCKRHREIDGVYICTLSRGRLVQVCTSFQEFY